MHLKNDFINELLVTFLWDVWVAMGLSFHSATQHGQ